MNSGALVRLSLVRFGASFLLVLTTGVLNRILIADLGIGALIVTVVLSFQHLSSPFALLSGHLSDRIQMGARRRVPFIRLWTLIGAALVPLMPTVAYHMDDGFLWLVAGALLFGVFGFGLKAANLLVGALLVDSTPDASVRGRQLNFIWIMAIVGFILAGFWFSAALPVFDPSAASDVALLQRLCWITPAGVVALIFLGTWRVEAPSATQPPATAPAVKAGFGTVLREVLATRRAQRIFLFLVLADFSFFVQEFILEAFGAEVFDLPLQITTSFNIVFGVGMVLSMLATSSLGVLVQHFPTRKILMTSCALGACSFAALAFASIADAAVALLTTVFVLGIAKGFYNVGLAHLFMGLAKARTAGVLMGAWGAFGGFAVALGGLSGGVLRDAAQSLVGDVGLSYGLVFGVEVLGLLAALVLIARDTPADDRAPGT